MFHSREEHCRTEQRDQAFEAQALLCPSVAPIMSAMDVFAAQGLIDDTCLLQLSTASRCTMTRAARHNAVKRKMEIKMNDSQQLEVELLEFARLTMRDLAGIVLNCDHEESAFTAMHIMGRIHGAKVNEDIMDKYIEQYKVELRRRQDENESRDFATEGPWE